jgi:Tol biopolymer transport system component/PKD repeat protein
MPNHARKTPTRTLSKIRLGISVLFVLMMISGTFAQEPSSTPSITTTTVVPTTTIVVNDAPTITATLVSSDVTPTSVPSEKASSITPTTVTEQTATAEQTVTPDVTLAAEETATAEATVAPSVTPTAEVTAIFEDEENFSSEDFNSDSLGTFPIMPLSTQAYCQMDISDGGDNNPYTYTFTAVGENISGYSWNLGDGTISANPIINHTYSSAGSYPVTLDCTPALGFGTSLPQTTGYVQIMLPPPVAFFTIPEGQAFVQLVDGANPLTFTTNNMSSPDNDPNLTFNWSITGPSVSCTTATSDRDQICNITDYGTYDIVLTATSGTVSSVASRQIEVIPSSPIVDFTATPGYAIATGDDGIFSASLLPDSGPVTSWEWYFNGSSTPTYTGQTVTHTFTTDGSYSVRLVATGPGGAHEITRTVSVYATGQDIQAAFTMTQNGAGATPGTVNVCFENTSMGDINIYEWDFGDDGTIDSNESARYFCADFPSGFLSARLNVVSADGNVRSDAYRELILIARPEAVISGGPSSGTQATDFNFTGDQSTGSIDSYFWDFGDGQTSNNRNPGNIRLPIGNHRISLTVSGPGGSHTVYRDIVVSREEISCAISGEFAPLPNSLNQTYNANVTNALGRSVSYQWSVTNVTPLPTPADESTYTVNFSGEGTYQVTLNAFTEDGSVCSDTKTVNVTYPPLVCNISHNLPNPVFPDGLNYDYEAVVTGDGGRTVTYEWFLGGSSIATTANISQPNPLSATNTPSSYTLRYVATASDGNSCFEEIVVTPQPYPTLTCADVNIQGAGSPNPFTANHTYTASVTLVGGRTLTGVNWSVENGTPATSTNNPIAITWDPAYSTTNGSTTNTLNATITVNTPGQGSQIISCDREIAVTAPALSCDIQGDFNVVQGDTETYTANINNLNGRTPTIAWQLVKNSDNSVITLPNNTGNTFDISFLDGLGIEAGAYTLSYNVAVTNPTDSCNPSRTITVATADQNFICEGFTAYPTTVTHSGNSTYGFEIDNPRNIELEYDIVLVGPNTEERILYTGTTTDDGIITRAFALSDFAHTTYGLLGIYQIRVDVRAVDAVTTPYICSIPVNGHITVGTVAPSISFVDTDGDPINPSLIEYGQEVCVVNSSVENGNGHPDANYTIHVNGSLLTTNCFIPTIGNHNVQLVGTSDYPGDNRQWPANGNLTVYGTPSINITREPVQYAGIPIQFDGNGENITAYQWVFYNIDDINNPQQVGTASGETPTRTFSTAGRYRAVLTGHNPLRNVEQYIDFTLYGTNDLSASFVPSQYAGVAPMEVCFRDTSVGNGIISWHWEFLAEDDATPVLPPITNSTNASPCVTFPDPDTVYRVRLTVENATTSTSAGNIIRTYSMEESQVTFRIEPAGGNLYCFTPVASGNFTVTGWDLGDGVIITPTSADGSICHNYMAAGDYQVKMQFETPTKPDNEVERPFTVGPGGAPSLTANAVCSANRVATFSIQNTGASMTIADQAMVTGINGTVDIRPILLASGQTYSFDVMDQSGLLTLSLTDNISVTADTTCNYPPELSVSSICVSGVPSFIVENARSTDGPMATPQSYVIYDSAGGVVDSGTFQLNMGEASETISLPAGTSPYETYRFESTGVSGDLDATHTCSPAQVQVTSVCGNTTGLPIYTITNNDTIDMATSEAYIIVDSSGQTVANGSFQLTAGDSQDVILSGLTPYETYTFVSVSAFGNFNVDHTCDAPQVTVTPTCDPVNGLPVFTVTNPSVNRDMLVSQEYVIRDDSGAEVARSTFQLDAGQSTNVTLPAGTTPYGTYTFESTGVSGTFNVDHTCDAPQVTVTSICEGGLPVFIVNNPDPLTNMATPQEYVIRDNNGAEVARSTFQIPADGTARITLPAGTTPYGTYTFESTGDSGTFNVSHTCDMPQITVTSVCEGSLPVFVVTNSDPSNGMATPQEYVIRDSNGAEVIRSTFQLFAGDSTQRITLPVGTPFDVYTFESNGDVGEFTVTSNCDRPTEPTTGNACAGNDVFFVLNNSGAAVQDVPYTISNGSEVVSSGTVSIPAGGRVTVTLPASLNKGGNFTLTFDEPVPNVTVTVQRPCGFVIEPICGSPLRFVIDNENGFEGALTYTLTANGVDITSANNTVTFVAGGRVVISVPRGYRNNVQLTLNTPIPTTSTINCGALVGASNTLGAPTSDTTTEPFRFTGLSLVANAPVCGYGCPVYQLYHTDETGNWEIFRLDSSDPLNRVHVRENLSLGTAEGVVNLSPSLSPDNNWIVFQSNRDGNWELYVAPTSGGNPDAVQRLTYNSIAIDANPMWGPNNFVVFETTRHGNYDLYLIDMSTGEEYRLTDDKGDDINAYWSPDGNRVVFQSNRNNPDKWQLFELNIATGALRLLSEETGTTNDVLPQYSRDGSKIVFSNYDNAGDNGVLMIMDANGNNRQVISDVNGDATNPAWSPSDRYIAYQSDLGGNLNIYIYEVATGETRQLTDNAIPNYAPTWQCSDDRVIFTSDIIDGVPNIFEANASPISDPAILVDVDADQKTFGEFNDIYPESSPSKEHASREGQTSMGAFSEQTTFLFPPANLTPIDFSLDGLQRDMWEPINTCQ